MIMMFHNAGNGKQEGPVLAPAILPAHANGRNGVAERRCDNGVAGFMVASVLNFVEKGENVHLKRLARVHAFLV